MTNIVGNILGDGGGGGVLYRMRAKDTTLSRYVFWTTTEIDDTGAEYTGPGPLLDIVVQDVLGQPTS